MILDRDRLFPTDPALRGLAQVLRASARDLPIISPLSHTDPRCFAEDVAFSDTAALFMTPDHYVFRMMCSQGIALEALGVPRVDGARSKAIPVQSGGCLRRIFICSGARRRAFGWTMRFRRCSG